MPNLFCLLGLHAWSDGVPLYLSTESGTSNLLYQHCRRRLCRAGRLAERPR